MNPVSEVKWGIVRIGHCFNRIHAVEAVLVIIPDEGADDQARLLNRLDINGLLNDLLPTSPQARGDIDCCCRAVLQETGNYACDVRRWVAFSRDMRNGHVDARLGSGCWTHD